MNKGAALLILVLTAMACQRQSDPVQATESAPPAIPQQPGASAELVENCDLLAEVMTGIPGSSLTRSMGSFEDDIGGSSREGCLVKIEGSFKALGTGETADRRISLFAESRGWLCDGSHSADGPDGTVFAYWTPTAWCLVTGRWDGGDDSNPNNVPGSGYGVTVGCAAR